MMRIDAVFVLALGAISYLKFMLQIYDDVFLAVAIFIASGSFGIWMGFSFGASPEKPGRKESDSL